VVLDDPTIAHHLTRAIVGSSSPPLNAWQLGRVFLVFLNSGLMHELIEKKLNAIYTFQKGMHFTLSKKLFKTMQNNCKFGQVHNALPKLYSLTYLYNCWCRDKNIP